MSALPCPPDLALERQMVGDLAPDSPEATHLETCETCKARLDSMRREGAAYMTSESAAAVRRVLRQREKPFGSRVLSWGLAAPVAAAAAWFFLSRTPAPADLATKGRASVELLIGHDGVVVPWAGAALAQGDQVQLSWTSAHPGFVCVVGREDSGDTVRWFPTEGRAARLEPGTRTFGDSLRFSPVFHGTVYVFVSESSFATDPLLDAVRAGRPPAFAGEERELHIPRAP